MIEQLLRAIAELLNDDAGFRIGIHTAEYVPPVEVQPDTRTVSEPPPLGDLMLELVGGERIILSVDVVD